MTAILHQHRAMPTAQLMTHPMMQSCNTLPINGCHTVLSVSYVFASSVVRDPHTIDLLSEGLQNTLI